MQSRLRVLATETEESEGQYLAITLADIAAVEARRLRPWESFSQAARAKI